MVLPNQRRPRVAFTVLAASPLRRITPTCTADPNASSPAKPPTPTTSNASTTPSENIDFVRTRMETARTRVRLLNNRVVVRAGVAAIRRGERVLSDDEPVPADSDAPDVVIKNLRRDLRSLRRVTEKHGADEDALAVISKLEVVADAIDARLKQPRVVDVPVSDTSIPQDSSATDEALYLRDDLEDDLEGAVPPDLQPDLVCAPEPVSSSVSDAPPQFMDAVKKKVIDSGNTIKRRASGVGASIEEKVAEFVHADGTVDVDGLRNLVGTLLDNVNMTWQRLNGRSRTVGDGDGTESSTEVESSSLSVRDTDKEFELQKAIGELESQLITASKERELVLRREDQLGKLMRAKEIRAMDDGVNVLRRTLALKVLQLEMEKVFVSIADEIENSDSEMMMEQRVLVVEFGELDERLATLQLFIDQEEPSLLDDDTLGELASDILELKTRLGLDSSLYSTATLSWPQVRQFFTASTKKTREGLEFYSRGLRLFAGDVRFAMRLIRRAVTGYTPSPREIRTLRRTGRDLLTLIPFTIVLLAPLTPVGHVLIFSFIQRYWPEFFPSTFTESRQAIMKRHEQYAKSIREQGENGLDGGTESEGSTIEGDGGSKDGLFGWKRFLLSNVEGEEVTIIDEDEKSKNNGKSGDESIDDEDAHPVDLNDLAESARDSGRAARKRRNAIALDDLHLAD